MSCLPRTLVSCQRTEGVPECCVTDSVRRRPEGFWRLFLYRAEKTLANDFPIVYSAVVINTVKG